MQKGLQMRNLFRNEVISVQELFNIVTAKGLKSAIEIIRTKEDASLYNDARICHKDDIKIVYVVKHIDSCVIVFQEMYNDTRTHTLYDTLVYCPNDDYVYLAN